jgi:dihydrodipicolinate synthase/N-acetylneuraminate lyase
VSGPLRGAIAAALTPLTEGGARLDEDAFEPYLDFLAAGGLDGVLAFGSTGEGILFSEAERKRGAELFVAGPLPAIVHCGAQTTAETVSLAAHAAELGAAGVAVIGPPYFAYDERALLAHFEAAAVACAPTPFYFYEFEARTGYTLPVTLIERLRDRLPHVVGLKVSDSPWERVEPYVLEGLDVFVGQEELIAQGLAAGGAGAVSGIAAALPELIAAAVRDPDGVDVSPATRVLGTLPFPASVKAAAAARVESLRADVRPPLRRLTSDERTQLQELLDSVVPAL